MKRHTLVIFILCWAACAAAQPRLSKAEMYVGLQGGVIASMMRFSPVVQGTNNVIGTAVLGGNGGFVFRYNGHKYCGLQVELNYMQRGWRETVDTINIRYSRRLHYIELPFLFHLYFGSARHRAFLNIGPQIGYCLASQASGTGHPTYTEQYKPVAMPFEYGLAAGLGYVARTQSAGCFQLEARFNYSFSDLFPNHKSDYFAQSSPMALSLNLAYLWEIK